MKPKCTTCGKVTDLSQLDVGAGHVYDCDKCNEPRRVVGRPGDWRGVPINMTVAN